MPQPPRQHAATAALLDLDITDLSHDGRGVARNHGKIVFVPGALPGEQVQARVTRSSNRFDEAVLLGISSPAPERVQPPCPHFGRCGGCTLQHMGAGAQLRAKQLQLAAALERIAHLQPAHWLEPVSSPAWAYRSRARFAVAASAGTQQISLGLRRGASADIEALNECPVLDPRLSALLATLNAVLRELRHADRLHELWLAAGENAVALAFSAAPAPHPDDVDTLQRFCAARGLGCHITTLKDRRASPAWAESEASLSYHLLDRRLELQFQPWHFTQANRSVNESLVHRVLQLMAPGPGDRALDLFCGLGNFSLPLALHTAQLTGIEGNPSMVSLARRNAAANGISNAQFIQADLAQDPARHAWARERYELVLLDPPRTGAAALLPTVLKLGARRIAYVSCDVATLARDAAALCARGRYKLEAAGVLDMFPHTAHVEALALFGK